MKKPLRIGLLLLLIMVVLRWPGPLPPGWTVLRPPRACFALLEEDGQMWVGSWEGLFRGTKQGLLPVDTGRRLQYVRTLCRDHRGVLWVGHNGGLSWREGGAFHHLSQGLPDLMVTALVEDERERLWIATLGGLMVRENGQLRPVPLPGTEQRVSCLLVDRTNGLWVGTDSAFSGGLVRRSAEGDWQVLGGLPHPHINCLVQDPGGDVWAGTGFLEDGGACRFSCQGGVWQRVQLLTQADGLPSSNVRSLLPETPGGLWLGMEYAGLAVQNGSGYLKLGRRQGLPNQEVLSMLADSQGSLWVATRDGVLVLSPEARQKLRQGRDPAAASQELKKR